jgi:hypothetical protein
MFSYWLRYVGVLLLLLLVLLLLSSLVTGWLSSLVLLPLSQWWTPPPRLQVSACSTFLMMCDVPSMAVFCRESTECCPGIVSRYFCKLLLTITVAPMSTGMTKHFMFHILWISVLICLYFNFFSASFCITFLSDVLLHQSISRFCPCFWLLCQACLPKPLYPFISLDSIKQLYLHVQLLA